MTEVHIQPEPYSDGKTNEGRLSYEDALLIAHDPTFKEKMDKAAANRRVAKKLTEGVEVGVSAIPEIIEKGHLARMAMGNKFSEPYDRYDRVVQAVRSVVPKIQLRGQNYTMLDEEDRAASMASNVGFHNVYHDHGRKMMTPDEIRRAEMEKARNAVETAEKAEALAERRSQEIFTTKESTGEVLGQIETVKSRLAGHPELPAGNSWEVYGGEALEQIAAEVLAMVRDTPGLRELIAKGLQDMSEEK